MSYRSRVYYTGTGSAQNLSVTFPYLDITHVHIFVDSVMVEDDTWSWLNSQTITVTAAAGSEVEIRRVTPYDPMVTFTNASLLNQDDQNTAALQAIYLIEEGAAFSEVVVDKTRTYALTFVIEGGGGVDIVVGESGSLLIPMSCTINAAYLLANSIGDIEVDIWKSSYANHPSTVADSVVAAAPLVLVNASASLDATLTGWTTTIARNEIITFNVNSCTGMRRLTVVLLVTVAD